MLCRWCGKEIDEAFIGALIGENGGYCNFDCFSNVWSIYPLECAVCGCNAVSLEEEDGLDHFIHFCSKECAAEYHRVKLQKGM